MGERVTEGEEGREEVGGEVERDDSEISQPEGGGLGERSRRALAQEEGRHRDGEVGIQGIRRP